MPEAPRSPSRATALRYDPSRADAPVVTATGRGLIAERILAEAERAGVPVRRDPALAQALARLPIGQEVPEELFAAVAEALAWAYSLDLEARAAGRGDVALRDVRPTRPAPGSTRTAPGSRRAPARMPPPRL